MQQYHIHIEDSIATQMLQYPVSYYSYLYQRLQSRFPLIFILRFVSFFVILFVHFWYKLISMTIPRYAHINEIVFILSLKLFPTVSKTGVHVDNN